MDASESLAMSLYLSGNSTDYAGNMSCVTLQRELDALCSNASMAAADECNKSAQGISLAVPITMTAFGVLGNILALLVLYSSRQEAQARRTVFFVMLSGLAWTDLICQLAVSPIAIITYANKLRWVGGVPLCLYHGFMMVSFGMVMPLIICCMSLERLLAIKFSYCYTRRVTRQKAFMTFIACWGVTLAFTVLPFVGVGSYQLQYPGSWCFLNFHRESKLDVIYAGVFSTINILAIIIMIVSNLTVAGTLCRMRLTRRLANSPSLDRKLSLSGQFTPSSTTCAPGTVIRGKRHSDMEAQMIWFLGLITVAFSVCWLPLNVHILLMQFTGYTDCVLDLKVIRMASCNQILDPWLYVIFRKNSILRIVRRIRACFRPVKKVPAPRAPPLHRLHYMSANRGSFTIDASSYARTAGGGNRRVCRHLILGGADLIGDSDRGNGFVGAKLSGSNTDLLCSQCSLSEDDHEMFGFTIRDPLINLRLGSSPTSTPGAQPNSRFSFDQSSRSDIEEDSTHETDLLSDRQRSDLASELQRSPEKKAANTKSPLLKSKAESASSGPKEKLRWFLPGLNSNAGDAFASYDSTDTSSFPQVRPPSIKSPHPIYKQKVHPSRSLLSQMTPGFSPADFCRRNSATQSAFIFPSPHSAQDISQNAAGVFQPHGEEDDNDCPTASDGAGSLPSGDKTDSIDGENSKTRQPMSRTPLLVSVPENITRSLSKPETLADRKKSPWSRPPLGDDGKESAIRSEFDSQCTSEARLRGALGSLVKPAVASGGRLPMSTVSRSDASCKQPQTKELCEQNIGVSCPNIINSRRLDVGNNFADQDCARSSLRDNSISLKESGISSVRQTNFEETNDDRPRCIDDEQTAKPCSDFSESLKNVVLASDNCDRDSDLAQTNDSSKSSANTTGKAEPYDRGHGLKERAPIVPSVFKTKTSNGIIPKTNGLAKESTPKDIS